MPSGKQKAVTLSFSKKNEDIFCLLEEKKKDESFVQNDYICEAVRFYEENKDKSFNNLDEYHIRRIIDEKFEEFKKELSGKELSLGLKEEKEEFNNRSLEQNLNMDDSFLEDD